MLTGKHRRGDGRPTPAPKPVNKWLAAPVADDAARVIAAVFDGAERRGLDHPRTSGLPFRTDRGNGLRRSIVGLANRDLIVTKTGR